MKMKYFFFEFKMSVFAIDSYLFYFYLSDKLCKFLKWKNL